MPIIRLIRETREFYSDLIEEYDHVVISVPNKSSVDLNKICSKVFTILATFDKEYKFEYFPTNEGIGYLDCRRVS